MRKIFAVVLGLFVTGGALAAGPHPALSGITAAADDASVAGNNPAGMTRFDSRLMRGEILAFFSDNTWDGRIGTAGPTFQSEDSSTTVIPSGNMVMPFKEKWCSISGRIRGARGITRRLLLWPYGPPLP